MDHSINIHGGSYRKIKGRIKREKKEDKYRKRTKRKKWKIESIKV